MVHRYIIPKFMTLMEMFTCCIPLARRSNSCHFPPEVADSGSGSSQASCPGVAAAG